MTPVHYHRLMTPMTFIADISFFTVLWGLIFNIGPCGLHSPLTTRWVMFFLQALLTFLTFSQAPCCDDLLNNATLDACREVAYWSMKRPNCPQSILFIPVTLCCLCFLLSWSVFNEELYFLWGVRIIIDLFCEHHCQCVGFSFSKVIKEDRDWR